MNNNILYNYQQTLQKHNHNQTNTSRIHSNRINHQVQTIHNNISTKYLYTQIVCSSTSNHGGVDYESQRAPSRRRDQPAHHVCTHRIGDPLRHRLRICTYFSMRSVVGARGAGGAALRAGRRGGARRGAGCGGGGEARPPSPSQARVESGARRGLPAAAPPRALRNIERRVSSRLDFNTDTSDGCRMHVNYIHTKMTRSDRRDFAHRSPAVETVK